MDTAEDIARDMEVANLFLKGKEMVTNSMIARIRDKMTGLGNKAKIHNWCSQRRLNNGLEKNCLLNGICIMIRVQLVSSLCNVEYSPSYLCLQKSSYLLEYTPAVIN